MLQYVPFRCTYGPVKGSSVQKLAATKSDVTFHSGRPHICRRCRFHSGRTAACTAGGFVLIEKSPTRLESIMKSRILTAAVALILTACGGDTPSPSPTQSSPTPPPASNTQWRVTQRFVSVNGPDNCWVREQRQRWTGAVFPDLPMSVTRSGGTITLEGTFFAVNYAGTISGNEFLATGVRPLEGGGRPCQDGTSFQQLPGVSRLSGRFADDDQSLTATEVNSYNLTSGEPVTYTWDWRATRQ